MSFEPRTARAWLSQMAYIAIARSGLRDLSASSVLLQILSAAAQGLASVDARIYQMTRAFFFDGASGALLDDRAAELPDAGLARRGAVAASGSVVRLTRASTAAALTVTPGALLGRSDSGQIYRTLDEVNFAIGVAAVDGVSVVAVTPGAAGNAPAGTITRLVEAPAELVAAVNLAPVGGGSDRESDDRLRARLRLWFSGLAGSQPAALEAAALSFIPTDASTVRYAYLWEDPRRPGYSELVIDDGSGGAGGRRAMHPSSGTVGAGGALMFWHEAPAVAPIDVVHVVRGSESFVLSAELGHFVSCPERGVVWVLARGLIEEGDVWTIDTNAQGLAHEVYTGIIAELQRLVEGDVSRGRSAAGKRAAGTRVRVRPARAQLVALDLHVVPDQGVDLPTLTDQIRASVLRFFQGLAPGQTLRASALVADLHRNPDLLSVRVYKAGTRILLEDLTPSSADLSLRSTSGQITIVPAAEES